MKKLSLCLLLQVTALVVFGQTKNFSVFDSSLARFDRNHPQEKVFVQTDKQYYYAGDTMWMKAWCTLNNMPTLLSRILYIDLTNAMGEVVLKKMYLLDSLSSSPADFLIPQNLSTGTYSLNSYTLWMKNFPLNSFSKNIVVYGLDYDSILNQQQNADRVSLKFFPEGGNLIAGVTNRVAFKATTSNNLPENFEGYIADETDKKIIDISSVHDGIGSFELVPEAGKTYTAHIKKSSLVSYSYPLPASQTVGVSLKVENSNPNKIFVLIKRTSNAPSNLNVIAQINNSIVLKAKINLTNPESALAINKKDLPGGIIQITVFDENSNPIAERIAFVENYELKKAGLASKTINLNKKGLNVLDVSLPDVGKGFSGSCLVTSYVDEEGKPNTNENIASALYLTADVKGYVHNPGYYFKDKSPETLKNLDLLLMTQGWRRFEWQKILKEEMPALKYPVETSIAYKGRVFKTGVTKQPVEDGFISFIFRKNNKTEMIADSKIDSNGYFVLNNVNFYDTTSLSYMATNNKKVKFVTNVTMQPNYIDTLQFSQSKPEVVLTSKSFSTKDSHAEWIKKSGLNEKILETVIVRGTRTKEEIMNDKYATGEFNKRPGIIIDPTDFRVGKSLADMVQVSVPGIRIDKSDNFFEPIMRFGTKRDLLQYSVNGRMATANDIYNIDEDQIAMMKFFGHVLFDIPFDMYPAVRPHLAIYTKDKNRPYIAVHEKRYLSQDVLGYAITKKFYEPDYESMPKAGLPEDNRYTLYWNPNMKTSGDGKLNVKFYNNDVGKKYMVTIHGITKNGQIVYSQQVVE